MILLKKTFFVLYINILLITFLNSTIQRLLNYKMNASLKFEVSGLKNEGENIIHFYFLFHSQSRRLIGAFIIFFTFVTFNMICLQVTQAN